ncbi:hypothetical protein SDJN03_26781, partial [Cucurbita argyrosperma subsp. sororia]
MNIAASLSSLAALRLPVCLHCFRTFRTPISFPSFSILKSPKFAYLFVDDFFHYCVHVHFLTSGPRSARFGGEQARAAAQAMADRWPWESREEVGFEMVDAVAVVEGISMSSASFKALIG